MSRTVLRGARWPGDVAVRDGRIVAVGAVAAEEGDTVVRCDGDIVTAGFVNTHHHFYQWLTRGWAVDEDLFGWLHDALSGVGAHHPRGRRGRRGCGARRAGADRVHDGRRPPLPRARAATTRSSTRSPRPRGRSAIRTHIARGSMDLGQSRGRAAAGLRRRGPRRDPGLDRGRARAPARRRPCRRDRRAVQPVQRHPQADGRVGGAGPAARPAAAHPPRRDAWTRSATRLARFGRRPVALLDELGWIARRRVGRARHPLRRRGGRAPRCDGNRRRALPVEQLPPRLGHRPVPRTSSPPARLSGWASTGWPPTRSAGCCRSCGWRCSSRASAASTRRRSVRRTRCASRPKAAPAAWAARTWAGSSRACGPTSWCGPATTSPTSSTRSRGWCSVRSGEPGTSWSTASTSCGTEPSSAPTSGALRAELVRRARRLWPDEVPR